MSLTVHRLASDPSLGLRIVAGASGARRVVTWAHAIELDDPGPWLSGGELVMTTGLRLAASDDEQIAYVERLARAGTAALAFDTGTVHPEVPAAIRRAGDDLGFTVLAVAARTPFVAIARAVIDDLTAEQVRAVQAVVDGQERLARDVLRGGVTGLVSGLARALDAQVCVVDRVGVVLAAAGTEHGVVSRTRGHLAAAESGRAHAGRAVVDDAGHLVIQRLTALGEPAGHVAVATADALGTTGRLLLGHAVSLLSLDLAKPAHVAEAQNRLRTAVIRAAIDGTAPDPGVVRYFGFDPDAAVVATVLTEVGPLVVADRVVRAVLDESSVPYLAAPFDDGTDAALVFVVPADHVPDVPRRVHAAVRERVRRAACAGTGTPAPALALAESVRRARAAARVARRTRGGFESFGDLGTFGLLLSSQDEDQVRAIAASALAPLDEHDARNGTDLVATLDTFLSHNGHWESAAAALGVHRHTIRNRVDRAAEVLGRDLGSAHDRSELWIALRARDILDDDVRPGGPATRVGR